MALEKDKLKSWILEHIKTVRLACLIIGLLLHGLVGILYYKLNFSIQLLIAFCGTMILIGCAFPDAQKIRNFSLPKGLWTDIAISLAIAFLYAPFYVYLSYDIPFQVGSDELIFVDQCRYLFNHNNLDVFGLVDTYFYLPAGSFIVNGQIAKLLGDIDLENLRRVDGFFGLCIISCSYFFFRTFYPYKAAALLTILLGGSHTLIGLSRTAMRENHWLLVEMIALIVLVQGLRQFSARKLYAGGAILAVGFYTYYAGRILIILWLVFLVVYCLKKLRGKQFFRQYFKYAAPTLIAFLLAAMPMMIAKYKAPENAYAYPKEQLLIYPQGRAFLCDWESTTDLPTALMRNTFKGLTAFNNNLPDGGVIYWNYRHGIVDPLTGIFLWLGVFALIKRRKKRDLYLLSFTGFAVIWLFLSFLTTKNPNFSRMLGVLPFVVIFSYEGMKFLAMLAVMSFARGRQMIFYRNIIVAAVVLMVVLWNISLYADFARDGLKYREESGAAVRYVDSRKYVPNIRYYIISDEQHPFILYGGRAWVSYVRLFTGWGQTAELISPDSLINGSEMLAQERPVTLLLSSDVWLLCKDKIMQQYPNLTIYYIDGDRKKLAIEIPK